MNFIRKFFIGTCLTLFSIHSYCAENNSLRHPLKSDFENERCDLEKDERMEVCTQYARGACVDTLTCSNVTGLDNEDDIVRKLEHPIWRSSGYETCRWPQGGVCGDFVNPYDDIFSGPNDLDDDAGDDY